MRSAVRLVDMPGVLAGMALLLADWMTYPLMTIDHQDSVLLRLLADTVWEAATWVLGGAAIGLAWQHLPGRRGLTNVLPAVAAYAVIPLSEFVIGYTSSGAQDWLVPTRVAAFGAIMTYLALRMDKETLDGVQGPVNGGRFQHIVNVYGLRNFSARLTAALSTVLAGLAALSAVQGGDVSQQNPTPNTGPTQQPKQTGTKIEPT